MLLALLVPKDLTRKLKGPVFVSCVLLENTPSAVQRTVQIARQEHFRQAVVLLIAILSMLVLILLVGLVHRHCVLLERTPPALGSAHVRFAQLVSSLAQQVLFSAVYVTLARLGQALPCLCAPRVQRALLRVALVILFVKSALRVNLPQ